MHPFLLTKQTEASKSQKNDSKFSTKTKTMTMPLQNLFRYSSFKGPFTIVKNVTSQIKLAGQIYFKAEVSEDILKWHSHSLSLSAEL